MSLDLLGPPTGELPAYDQRRRVEAALAEGNLCAVFQAIVDLWTGEVCGYEVLTRPMSGFASIGELMEVGRCLGLTWTIESACRRNLFRTLGSAPALPGTPRLFLNVSPGVFLDSRFSPDLLRAEGLGEELPCESFVIEITEGEPMESMDRFRHQREAFRRQGIQVALDDFGGGFNGLSTFRNMQPEWLKLDMDLVRGVDQDLPGQEIVRSIRRLTATLDISLVAEGVETHEELRALAAVGIRYVQGYLLQTPQPVPTGLGNEAQSMVRDLLSWSHAQTGAEEYAYSAVRPACAIEPETVRGMDLDAMFRHDPELDHVVLARQQRPLGLISRNRYYRFASGPFGFPLLQRRWVDATADLQALILHGKTDLATAAAMAMGRRSECLYDPVIVVDDDGLLVGTMTIKSLLGRSTELRVNNAMSANPLTRLPGNTVIERWLDECLCQQAFTIVYADLDQFKAYNDTYGFAMGDRMIELVAELLVGCSRQIPGNVRVGHIGGDDFVLVTDGPIPEANLEAICAEFDQRRMALFGEGHREIGGYHVADRQGRREFCQLVTLSLAVIPESAFPNSRPHRARLAAVAASLKKRLKEEATRSGRSSFMLERRVYRG